MDNKKPIKMTKKPKVKPKKTIKREAMHLHLHMQEDPNGKYSVNMMHNCVEEKDALQLLVLFIQERTKSL